MNALMFHKILKIYKEKKTVAVIMKIVGISLKSVRVFLMTPSVTKSGRTFWRLKEKKG